MPCFTGCARERERETLVAVSSSPQLLGVLTERESHETGDTAPNLLRSGRGRWVVWSQRLCGCLRSGRCTIPGMEIGRLRTTSGYDRRCRTTRQRRVATTFGTKRQCRLKPAVEVRLKPAVGGRLKPVVGWGWSGGVDQVEPERAENKYAQMDRTVMANVSARQLVMM